MEDIDKNYLLGTVLWERCKELGVSRKDVTRELEERIPKVTKENILIGLSIEDLKVLEKYL